MNKKISKSNFILCIFILLTLLGTFLGYKNYAQEVTEEMMSTGTGMANGQVGARGVLTVNDLHERYDILCCSKGTPLPGGAGCTITFGGKSADEGSVRPGDEGKKEFEVTVDPDVENPYGDASSTVKTTSDFVVNQVKICTPMEAYILAEMVNNIMGFSDAGYQFIGDDIGQRKEFTDTALLSNCTYYQAGNDIIYVVSDEAGAEKFVKQADNGKYYYVEFGQDEGYSGYSYIQRAWWNTEAVTAESNYVPPNGLTEEARAFETYIERIAKSMNTADFIDYTVEIGGQTRTVKAPEIEYKPFWNSNETYEDVNNSSTYNLDQVTVSYDPSLQKYKIGPFSINYVEAGAAIEGRDAVQFAGITDCELTTDDTTEPLKLGNDWEFIWLDGERDVDDKAEFPHENEVFYIALNYRENATKITNFHFDFQYMNAGGQFEDLVGEYYEQTWTPQEQENWCYDGHKCSHGYINSHSWTTGSGENAVRHSCSGGTACEHGYYKSHIASKTYWVELESVSEGKKAQTLAGGLVGARWYEQVSIDRDIGFESGSIRIEKQVVDENGKPIDVNRWFFFKVSVSGSQNDITNKIYAVKAGHSVTTDIFWWNTGDSVPTYNVEEIPDDTYSLIKIDNASGSLKSNQTVEVYAENGMEYKVGKLKVIKKADEVTGHADALAGEKFTINVKISGTFDYKGTHYENATYQEDITLGIDEQWLSDEIKWVENNEAPKYEVTEIENNNPDSKFVGTINGSGSIVPGTTDAQVVYVINAPRPKEAQLKVIKTVDDIGLLSEEDLKAYEWTFRISVDGYDTFDVVLDSNYLSRNSAGGYEWTWTSDKFVWYGKQAPHYKIEEINNPEGTHFVSASAPEGTLTENGTETAVIENDVINHVDLESAKIQLTKVIGDDEKLKNSDYYFYVTVYGAKFSYKGTVYTADQKVQLTDEGAILLPEGVDRDETKYVTIHVETESSTWISDKIEWMGEAPKYLVEEKALGENYNIEVLPKGEQILSNNENGVAKVTANNTIGPEDITGYLHIIKTLDGEQAKQLSKEYISNLKFNFTVEISNQPEKIPVTLVAEASGDGYVWETTLGPIKWKNTEAAPTYQVTEAESDEYKLISSEGLNGTLKTGDTIELSTVDCTVTNHITDHEGTITIVKNTTSESLTGKDFKFKLTLKGSFTYNGETIVDGTKVIEDITVKAGSSWTSSTVQWLGNDNPSYSVEEIIPLDENGNPIAKQVSTSNATGKLTAGSNNATVTFVNESVPTGGQLVIKKVVTAGANDTDEFYFAVSIEGYEEVEIAIKANETWTSDYIVWDSTEPAPTYSVTELPSKGYKQVSISNAQGTLSADSQVVVTAENSQDENKGNFDITKVVIYDEKLMDKAVNSTFTIEYELTSDYTFYVEGNTYGPGKPYSGTAELAGGKTYTSPEVTWYGSHAPILHVNEKLTDQQRSQGWKLGGISNKDAQLIKNMTISSTVTNELPVNVIIDLTMQLGGTVWVDAELDENDKNMAGNEINGIKDSTEQAPEDQVLVYVYYAGTDELATIYADLEGSKIEQPLIIDPETGNWEAPRVKVPASPSTSYDVRFVYDGQKYEPTKFLATADGNASAFINAKTGERDKFANDSMALDIDRDEVNNRIVDIYGNQVIDSNMYTVGSVSNGSEQHDVYYKGEQVSLEQSVDGLMAIRSKLQTYNPDTLAVYDLYKATATTQTAGLTFPFDVEAYDGYHLENYDIYLDELGLNQLYQYQAVYYYCQHINLGLIERPEADTEVTKDLAKAVVVANNGYTEYEFNKLADMISTIQNEPLKRKIEAGQGENELTYKIGLYETDYYYRAEMYKANGDLYEAIATTYGNFDNFNENSELEIYLQYRITLYDTSADEYKVVYKELNDYFDSSFSAPIMEDVYKQFRNENGNLENVKIIEGSDNYSWTLADSNIKSSDGTTYNKYTVNLNNLQLDGTKQDILVTVKVHKDTINGVQEAVELGDKSNVVEVAKYQTLDSQGRNAGKIDYDSAPANLDIKNHNDKSWYEDDTAKAPVLKLELQDTQRQVSGTAWEDKAVVTAEVTAVGDGVYSEDEALIGGLTTQLVENIALNGKNYEFVWPTNDKLDALGGKSIKEVSGFDSTIETARENNEELGEKVGQYKFTSVPSGNYAVKFLYGIEKANLDDTIDTTGVPTAYKADGTIYSGNENIKVANYDGDIEGATQAVYNGQDYKTTLVRDGYLVEKVHDFKADTEKNNDAIDNEAQRLAVISNSVTMLHNITRDLHEANYFDGNHETLYNDYDMSADTAIMTLPRLAPEGSEEVNKYKTFVNFGTGVQVEVTTDLYEVANVDCGLVERPENNIVLDKQISSIKLTTNDNKVIFDAEYNINYKEVSKAEAENMTVISALPNGKVLVAEVELDSTRSVGIDLLQALNKSEAKLTTEVSTGEQNFRFINVDDAILQGTEIRIDYRLTAINVGEVDYTTATLAEKTEVKDILALSKEVKDAKATTDSGYKYGKYLGSYYYTGVPTDTVVTTKVRQVVDYVDADAVVTIDDNQGRDASWRTATITDLAGNGVEANRLVSQDVIPGYKLTDCYNRDYITNSQKNIILSMDVQDDTATATNIGFESDLVPYVNETTEGYKSAIDLEISRVVSAGDVNNKDNKFEFDNIAEIVKFENNVGRRDIATVAGNANPHLGEFTLDPITNFERDTSATEVITFTPPTGIQAGITLQMQILLVVAAGLVVLSVGTIIIKKVVLK